MNFYIKGILLFIDKISRTELVAIPVANLYIRGR